MRIFVVGTELPFDDLFKKTLDAANAISRKERKTLPNAGGALVVQSETAYMQLLRNFPTYYDLVIIIMRDPKVWTELTDKSFLDEMSKDMPVVIAGNDLAGAAEIDSLFGKFKRRVVCAPEQLIDCEDIPSMVMDWREELVAKGQREAKRPVPQHRYAPNGSHSNFIPLFRDLSIGD